MGHTWLLAILRAFSLPLHYGDHMWCRELNHCTRLNDIFKALMTSASPDSFLSERGDWVGRTQTCSGLVPDSVLMDGSTQTNICSAGDSTLSADPGPSTDS